MKLISTITLSILFFILSFVSNAQPPKDTLQRNDAPTVFLICDYCDQNYYKNEITFLNFVRDRRLADIVILLRTINTGNGGTEFTLEFSGENSFKEITAVEKFNAIPNLSNGEIREGIRNAIKKGVLSFLLKSPLSSKINYSVEGLENTLNADQVKDKWNLWLFSISGNLSGSGQAYSKQFNMNSNFSANRTSQKNRFESGFYQYGNFQNYKVNDTTSISAFVNNIGAYSFNALSIGNHAAIGYYATYFASTVQNLKNSTSFYPSIEYNIFPYDEATKRRLTFNYRIGARYVDFFTPTYLDRLNEWYFLHSLVVSYRQVEKWGSLNCDIGSFQYFHKQKYYRVNISPNVSLNVAKGLNVNLGGSFSVVNDQYFLKKDEVSQEAILLGQAQLKSNFSYFFYSGISFNFGSIYNNVVNVRFNMSDSNW
jgi:hypothetical protein